MRLKPGVDPGPEWSRVGYHLLRLRAADRHAIAHNKIMIIDQATIITGSFNFTKAAEEKNAENMLVIKSNPAQLYEP